MPHPKAGVATNIKSRNICIFRIFGFCLNLFAHISKLPHTHTHTQSQQSDFACLTAQQIRTQPNRTLAESQFRSNNKHK